jgi:hypothetical protein
VARRRGLPGVPRRADRGGHGRIDGTLPSWLSQPAPVRLTPVSVTADPKGIVASAPGVGPILSAGILGRLGDAKRFANLGAVRSVSGLVPGVGQSGKSQQQPSITKQGDPGLRRYIWLAAELARHQDPNWRPSTTGSSSYAGCTTTRLSATWPRPCSLASPPAGAPGSFTSSATPTAESTSSRGHLSRSSQESRAIGHGK